MLNALLVALGGGVGSAARYGVGGVCQRFSGGGFPLGTLAVNVLGCLVMGMLGAFADKSGLAPSARLFFMTGILGGFTTFSAFGYETAALLCTAPWLGLANAALQISLGLAAVGLGRFLVSS